MKISRKKILIAAIVLFCLFFLIVFGLELKQRAREKSEATQQEEQLRIKEEEIVRQKMEKEIQVQKCIKTAGEINFPEMIDLTEQLSKDLAFREKIKIYVYPFSLLVRHARCEFEKEQNEEKKNALVNYVIEARRQIVSEEVKENVMARLKEVFIHPEEFFINNLSLGNMAEICPDKLLINCRKDNGIFFLESDEWCEHICETLAQYEKDKDKLNKEVINFKDWEENIIGLRGSQFNWRLAIAYRFGGKDLARKVCENVAETQKKDTCLSAAVSFETRELPCETAFEQLAQLICNYKYKNY